MGYKNANEVFPSELLVEIQKHIDGEYIYIPRKLCNRKIWGASTDTKQYITERNLYIYKEYQEGVTEKQLAEKYHLVKKSIQRIIRQEKRGK